MASSSGEAIHTAGGLLADIPGPSLLHLSRAVLATAVTTHDQKATECHHFELRKAINVKVINLGTLSLEKCELSHYLSLIIIKVLIFWLSCNRKKKHDIEISFIHGL